MAAESVADAVERLIASVELDEATAMNAAIARALAAKLDEARLSQSGPVAMAIAGIAKELRAVVDAILQANTDDAEFVSGIFDGIS